VCAVEVRYLEFGCQGPVWSLAPTLLPTKLIRLLLCVQWKCDSWSLAAKDLCGPWHPPSYPPNSSGCCYVCSGSAIAGVWLPRTCGPWHPPSYPPNSPGCCDVCSGSAIAGVWLPRTCVVLGTHPLTHQTHLVVLMCALEMR
jgi:hypothetical protein